MSTAFLGYFKFLARQAWIDKGIRTLLAVTPGLGIFLITGNKAGVAFAFSALCLSAPYADRSFRPIHLVWLAPVGAVCMTVAVWLQDHPALYIPVFGVIGGVSVLVQRSGRMPGRITIWFLIYVLYQSSELRDSRLKDTIAAALWVAPAAVWTYVVCFWLWPRRNPETSGVREGEEKQMSVGRHALCGGLSIAVASVVAFACRLPHTNWAIWSSYTVIRPSRKASLKRSVERLLGAVIGCSVGFFAIKAFGELPLLLGTLTILAVFLMVAFQKYTLAVAVRSALAPLAAFALHGDPIGTALARFLCILVGVIIGTFFMLSFTKE